MSEQYRFVRVDGLGQISYDLNLDVTALDRGGGRRLFKQDAGLVILVKKLRERASLRLDNEDRQHLQCRSMAFHG